MGKKCISFLTDMVGGLIGTATFGLSIFLLCYIDYWPFKLIAFIATYVCAYFIGLFLDKIFKIKNDER
ncbi:hypothetical protein CYR55_22535 [Chimaeribacter californicus]|uniref:Uncharacterized protein n=1 Tax=Chimaeribacter californicus TaxID=2060067 RepID=A0A2N5DTN7_9GAMM|nr:hypothetical protein CYR55_22535 [Chimaeribacter californicus]